MYINVLMCMYILKFCMKKLEKYHLICKEIYPNLFAIHAITSLCVCLCIYDNVCC